MATILLTVTNDLTYDQRMMRIATALQSAGFEVTLVGRQLAQSKPLSSQTYQQHRLPCYFTKGKFFYLEFNLRLLLWLLRQRFDLLCAIDLDTLWPAYLTTCLKRKPLVYDAHEYFSEVPEVVDRPFTKAVWEWTAARLIPRLKYAYTVGYSLADEFKQRYGVEFGVIRNLPNRSNLSEEAKPAKRILLYQGVLNEGRGLEALLEAMRQLEGVELWLAGEGDRSAALRGLAEKWNLGEKVKFLGYVLPKELPAITAQAWLGFNLLENKGKSYYFSLANKTFDYIQLGIPALHMDFPEYRRLNDTYQIGLLLKTLSPQAIIEAIQQLQNDPNLYQQLAENCKKAAPVLCWEEEAKTLIQFYQDLKKKEGL